MSPSTQLRNSLYVTQEKSSGQSQCSLDEQLYTELLLCVKPSDTGGLISQLL